MNPTSWPGFVKTNNRESKDNTDEVGLHIKQKIYVNSH